MYTDIFIFAIAFTTFSLYTPQEPPVSSPALALLCCGAAMAGVYVFCRVVFLRCARAINSAAAAAEHYGKALTVAKFCALGAYCVLIMLCGLKQALPRMVYGSELALNACGVAVFSALLLIVWLCAFPAYRNCCDALSTRGGFTAWNARLSLTLILPWILFAAFLDGLSLLPAPVLEFLSGSNIAAGLLLALVIGIIGIFFPWTVVRLWGCTDMPPGPVRDRIEDICRRARVRCAGIYLWNLFGGHTLSAGVLGFVPAFRYLLISPALLSMLGDDELDAVIAHECGHVRHRHMLFYLIFILGYGFWFTALYGLFLPALHTSDRFLDMTLRPDGTFGFAYHALILASVLIFFLLYFRILFGYFSRTFERQADCAALRLTGSAQGIAGALAAICSNPAARTAPNWHHYSITERIAFVNACERSPEHAARHARRVRAAVSVFCALLAVSAVFLWMVRNQLAERNSLHTLLFVEKMSQRRPDDAVLRFQLAGLYYEKKLFSEAEKEYRYSIALRPDFYDAYNNLAWLYATCEQPSMRNYPEALRLSRIAVSLAPHAYILDTLAECLFVNGLYRQAVIAAEEALRAAEPENRLHYENQIKKFRGALPAEDPPSRSDKQGITAV